MSDTIAPIMSTPVYTAQEGQAAGEVLQDLLRAGFSGCPVVNDDGEAVGVISWRDLVPCGTDTIVRDRMSTPPVVTPPETTLADAARLMVNERVHRLIVIEANRVVGILSAIDIVRAVSAPPRLTLAKAASIG